MSSHFAPQATLKYFTQTDLILTTARGPHCIPTLQMSKTKARKLTKDHKVRRCGSLVRLQSPGAYLLLYFASYFLHLPERSVNVEQATEKVLSGDVVDAPCP